MTLRGWICTHSNTSRHAPLHRWWPPNVRPGARRRPESSGLDLGQGKHRVPRWLGSARVVSRLGPKGEPNSGSAFAPPWRSLAGMRVRVSFLGALLAALTGCTTYTFGSNYYCTDPDKGHLGPDGKPDPCHERDTSDAGPDLECGSSEPVHVSIGWAGPTRLWVGSEEQAQECPYGAASTSYEGHTDLFAPAACETCACEPPTGSCALPSTLTVSTAVCYAPGTMTSFNAPDPWDGLCDSTTQIPAGKAYSLTIDPMTMTENGCAPGPPVAAKVISSYWQTFARTCDGKGWTSGALSQTICIPPDDPTPPGFNLCIFQNGENDCPTESNNVFTVRHVFYKGVQDDRQCSACTCGAPTGSVCTATISIYKGTDLTCSGPALDQKTVSSEKAACLDIAPTGQALGSKSAGPMTYLPGTCPAIGGDGSGNAIPTQPATLCCRP